MATTSLDPGTIDNVSILLVLAIDA